MLAALLQTVRRRQHQGDQVGARVVLRALAIQQHDDPRIWLALATVATSRDEQRQALEQAISLDPQNAAGATRLGAPQRQTTLGLHRAQRRSSQGVSSHHSGPWHRHRHASGVGDQARLLWA